jgi:adenylate kinase family enzyme
MGTGIIICGLNGVGKSTLGKALAEKLDFYFIDNEDLFFPKDNPDYLFASPRTRIEVEKLLFDEVKAHENFVLSAVKGNYGEDIIPLYQYAVLVEVPKKIRIQRVKDRSFQKFGERMLSGGDLFEKERKFFDIVEARPENYAEEWVQSLDCPVIRVDGTRTVEQNVDSIIESINQIRKQ